MSDETVNDDVNAGEDRVTADHDAGLGTSAEELETHNPDIDDYDTVVKDMDDLDDDVEDPSGGTISTDDTTDSDDDVTGADKDKDDEDEARIPKSRLDEVIAQRDKKDEEITNLKVEAARTQAIFEGRLAALEKPVAEAAKEPDPFDDVLAGEPQAILDAFQEDPAGFVRMIQSQAKVMAAEDIAYQREEEQYQKALHEGMDTFTEEHPDVVQHADKLVKIVNTNPIHNVVSAYAYEIEIPALKASHEEAIKDMDAKIAAAKAEGIAEGKKEAIKDVQAKSGAAVLDGSSASQASGKANAGAHLDTGGDGVKLREKITAELLAKRAASGA